MTTYPPARWRLIRDGAGGGAWNMAVDEAILEATGRGEVPPTLRLYAWEPPCLSLGYSQPAADVDRLRLQVCGWNLVRRPTGGRSILHTDEVTYSVAGPADDPRLAGSVLDSYRRLAGALLDALHRLGIHAEASEKPTSGHISEGRITSSGFLDQNDPVCFGMPSNYEITVAGKKLIGSAQARRKEGVLQHGSLPLSGDLSRITQVLTYPNEDSRLGAAARLLDRAATVETLLGDAPSWEQAAQAFAEAFAHTLNLDLRAGGLTAWETARAIELERVKYGSREWTDRI